MRRIFEGLGIVGLLAGCGAGEGEAAKSVPAKPEPARAEAVGGDSRQVRPADGGEDVPPSGLYEVTTRVVADDCTPKYTPPAATTRVRVDARAEGERARVNVPLSGLPPARSAGAAMRSDFVVVPATPVKEGLGDGCGPSMREFVATAASREGFTLAITSTFGRRNEACDAAAVPQQCTTTIEQAYRVVSFECAAECHAGQKARPPREDGTQWAPDERVMVDCRCPPA
ncbi:MAG: hypothetical protein JNL82_07465 [Myxococcales bacterium]|nr:hypothetical protein [Myxococcales bacterium]